MTMIHPVCRRFPISISVWDDTNLPLSCVITPLATDLSNSSPAPPPLLSSIPKCLQCGAPHASNVSHYPMQQSLLCHLCGKTSSTWLEDQVSKRVDEVLDADTYEGSMRNKRGSTTALGTNSMHVSEFTMPISKDHVSLPAMSCPPLWWIVVEGSPSRAYWNTIAQALSAVVSNLPPHVHLGLAMASSTHFSLWDVTSAVPFVQHYENSWENVDMIVGNVGTHQSNIQSALRAMGDSMVVTEGRLPLVKILQVLLDQVSDGGQHPGQSGGIDTSSPSQHLKPYAGGRVLVLLNGAPQELQQEQSTSSTTASRQMGAGGRGGACFESGKRFQPTAASFSDSMPDLEDEHDPESGRKESSFRSSIKTSIKKSAQTEDDLTPLNLEKQYPNADHRDLMKQFHDLGQDFAEAAFGLDFLVVQDQLQKNADVGLPLFKPLYEPTGAPGPVLFDLTTQTAAKELKQEIWSRRPSCFGGLLRVRMSPGFKVDTTPVEPKGKHPLQMAPLHVRKGLMGPAAATGDEGLWCVGACDPHQAMSIDFQVTNKIKRFAFVDGMGEVALKPCMQVCFAYTTVVPNDTGDEEYVTVRRMRISTIHMPMANSVESLYAGLDTEALSTVLFHKLALNSFMEPVIATQDTGRSWLKDIMVCAYRSAEEVRRRQKLKVQHGMDPQSDETSMFFASERLLNEGGSLSKEDVLMGQGHDTLRLLPLLVWGILQSDAIRPSNSGFRPTLDARSAALMQMSSMSPLAMANCAAPRLELWASGNDAKEPIVSHVDLSMQAIAVQLMEHQQTDPDLILFLDAPYGIIICDSRHLRSAPGNGGVVVGPALEISIQRAISSYRTPPPVTYALDLSVPVAHLWEDYLMEDSTNFLEQTFEDWKNEVAAAVYNALTDGSDN